MDNQPTPTPAPDQSNSVDQPPTPPSAPADAPTPTPEAISAPTPTAPEPTPVVVTPPIQESAPTQVQPFTNQPQATPVSTPTPDATKRKKLIILISIIVGALVVVGVVATILISMFTVSKEDYKEAYKQFTTLSQSTEEIPNSIDSMSGNFSSGSESDFNQKVDDIKKDIASISDSNDKFSKLKAVSVGEGKTKYDAFNKSFNKAMAFLQDSLDSFVKIRPALLACADTPTDTLDMYIEALGDCIDALGKIDNLPIPEVQDMISDMKTGFTDMRAGFIKLQSIKSPYGSQSSEYQSAMDAIDAASDKMSKSQKEFSKKIDDKSKEISSDTTATDLESFLKEKSE